MNFFQHLGDHFVPNARNNYRPHAISHRSLSLYAALLVCIKILTIASLDFIPEGHAFSSAVTERNILELTNYSRSQYRLDQLNENGFLDEAAQQKANDMLQNQYFAHVSPDGVTPWDFINAQHYNYIIAGENLAINFYSAEGVENAWMNSPEHKANILNKDFEDIGIGISEGQYKGVNAIFVVQMFGTSINQPITPKLSFSSLQTLPQSVQQNQSVAQTSTVPTLKLPSPVLISQDLQTPIVTNTETLTNKKQIVLNGSAYGASSIYVLDNHQPVVEIGVVNGLFSGSVDLQEGQNIINVIGFDANAHASKPSADYLLTVNTSAPKILNATVIPQEDSKNIYYKVDVQTQGDPVKVLATLGTQSVLLQPTADPGTWEGMIAATQDQIGNLTVSAYDLAGNSSYARVASFSGTLQNVFGFLGIPAAEAQVSILNHWYSASSVNLFYLYFAIALLATLALAIGLRKHVLHLGLVAHVSAMVIIAVMFWVT